MTRAIRVHETGAPEVLRWEEVDVPAPGPGEARIRQTAVGLNYIDIYYREGVYPPAALPYVPGQEGAGVVEAVGPGVADLRPGDRVAYAGGPLGAYAEARVIPADRLVKVPEGIADDTAAAMMLKGMTAQYLLRQTRPIGIGDVIVFHAAAGGVGQIACQWAKHLGATVIGTVGSDAKVDMARASGCDHVIVYSREDVAKRVAEIMGGKKADVVYDGVGQATFEASLDCVRSRGMLVVFGQASGKVPPFDISRLAAKGSLYLTRPTLFGYTATRAELLACAGELFEVVQSGAVKIPIGRRYPLREAAEAQRALAGRETTGATVLTV